MCGIAGLFSFNRAAAAPERRELLAISDHMKKRGPDGQGEWWSADNRIALAHRRLAIIDPADRAAQPMTSSCGRYVIVFNGEIYNYRQLRAGLETGDNPFRTQSDTEVILRLFAKEGSEAFNKLRGMYAMAIYDNEDRKLTLARDPYGIKPLYYANDGWTFRFASQVKSLLAGGVVSRQPEPAGAVGFFLFGHVPEPFTMYRDIRAVPAGSSMTVDAAGMREPRSFASIASVLAGAPPPSAGDFGLVLREATLDSVRHHLVADVEVGAFLSAGVDSGALVGLMRDCGQDRIHTVTLRYEEFARTPEDEAPLAAQTAALFDTLHTERCVTPAEFQSDLPLILDAMDQPSIDGINAWFASKVMRELGIKVAISGLGGDELLAGYPSFVDIPRWTRLFGLGGRIPLLGYLVRTAGTRLFPDFAARNPKALALPEYGFDYPGAYLLRRGLFLPHELKSVLPVDVVKEGIERLDPLGLLKQSMEPAPAAPIARVALLESANYMRNQLLRDADWAGMAQSVEIRVPLVDFTLLNTLAPWIGTLENGAGKRALATAPSLPLPSNIIQRQKTGFGIPVMRWMENGPRLNPVRKGQSSRDWSRRVFSGELSSVAWVN